MRRLETTRARLVLGAVVLLFVLGTPGLAAAQYYKYLATGTIQTVQAVDENYATIAGFDYTKINNAGVVATAVATGSSVIDSATLPTPPNPPDPTFGQYDGAYPVFTAGTFAVEGMDINNGIAVLDNRAAGQDDVPAAHDAFAYGGSFPLSTTGPSFLRLDNGTAATRKGSAVILVSWLGVQLLSSTSLPTSVDLANANLAKTMIIDVIDIDVGQRYTVTSTIDTLTIDLDAPAPPEPPVIAVPMMSGWMLPMLASVMLLMGAVFLWGARRSEA
jgi:hypothetical protein